MAEEAKKLAAYAAVDNHVQVPRAHLSYMFQPLSGISDKVKTLSFLASS